MVSAGVSHHLIHLDPTGDLGPDPSVPGFASGPFPAPHPAGLGLRAPPGWD